MVVLEEVTHILYQISLLMQDLRWSASVGMLLRMSCDGGTRHAVAAAGPRLEAEEVGVAVVAAEVWVRLVHLPSARMLLEKGLLLLSSIESGWKDILIQKESGIRNAYSQDVPDLN